MTLPACAAAHHAAVPLRWAPAPATDLNLTQLQTHCTLLLLLINGTDRRTLDLS